MEKGVTDRISEATAPTRDVSELTLTMVVRCAASTLALAATVAPFLRLFEFFVRVQGYVAIAPRRKPFKISSSGIPTARFDVALASPP